MSVRTASTSDLRPKVKPFARVVVEFRFGRSTRECGTFTGPRADRHRSAMPRYLVAIYHPDDYDPSAAGEAISSDIVALNDEMKVAGVRVFVGGLSPARSARSLRLQPAGRVFVSDGPYIETKEHIGGFWVLEAADLDEALAWGRKAAVACRVPVEVRPFN